VFGATGIMEDGDPAVSGTGFDLSEAKVEGRAFL
jgi:hypothetical protein